MIKFRSKPPTPQTLQSSTAGPALAKIKAKIEANQEVTSRDFDSLWLRDDVRLTLWKNQDGKCCYCERKRDPKGEPNIDHFRPKTEISDAGKPGYWWLAYDWDNLLFSCKRCNQKKGTHFPLLDGQRVRDPDGDVDQENPVLPHPEFEDPEQLISYLWHPGPAGLARPIGKDEAGRGSCVIAILRLDDSNLNVDRGRILLALQAIAQLANHAIMANNRTLLKQVAKKIKNETMSEHEFAGLRRAYFRSEGLGDYVSTA